MKPYLNNRIALSLAPWKGGALELTFQKQRGYHHWVCLVCGKQGKERIPDQAEAEYQDNPGNPVLGVCGRCNGGSPSAGIRLPKSYPLGKRSNDHQDGVTAEWESEFRLSELDGQWRKWAEIARRFQRKAEYQDREELRHRIILQLANVAVKYNLEGKLLTEGGMIRVAVYTVKAYWRDRRKYARVASLNSVVEDGEGNEEELIDTIADDRAIDVEAWADARAFLMGCPTRLVEIANKRASGVRLTTTEQSYLSRFRKRGQKRLF